MVVLMVMLLLAMVGGWESCVIVFWDPALMVCENGAGGWSTWWWRKWYILEWQVRDEMVEGMFLVCLVVVRVPASAGGYHQCSQAEAGNRKS